MSWTPLGGVAREIPVCGTDARRLEQGVMPDVRLVHLGDRYVKWYEVDQMRGLIVSTFGTEAVAGVP